MLDDWRTIIESGTILTDNSIYDKIGNLNHTAADDNKALVEKLRIAIRKKSLTETNTIVEESIDDINSLLKEIGI